MCQTATSVVVFVLLQAVTGGVIDHEPTWTHDVFLDSERRVRLRWTPRDDDIEFLVDGKATGYVGIGFSPTGSMDGADIALGWLDPATGQPHLVDCYGAGNGPPQRDESQDLKLIWASRNATHTSFRFVRKWNSCDEDDMSLAGAASGETTRVLWALGTRSPSADGGGLADLVPHRSDSRGARSFLLRAPSSREKDDAKNAVGDDGSIWDLRHEQLQLPDGMDTVYWCRVFAAPETTTKHHIIGYEPVLTPGSAPHVHHMLLYWCAADAATTAGLERAAAGGARTAAPCYSSAMPHEWDSCVTPVVAWAIGSAGEWYPDHVGVPLQSSGLYMLEVHYDNPGLKHVVDSSGLRLHLTNKARQYDGAVLSAGVAVSPLHVVPPRQPSFRSVGLCGSFCTSATLPEDGVRVVSVVLHSHTAGRRLKLRHIRGGRELPTLASDPHYDFRFQQSRRLQQEATILPGDALITECEYGTAARMQPTLGGYSTSQEMCLAFVLYYPAVKLASCVSMTPVAFFFRTLGVHSFYSPAGDMSLLERRFLLRPEAASPPSTASPSTTSSLPLYGGHPDDDDNQRAIMALRAKQGFSEGGDEAQRVAAWPASGVFSDLVIREPAEYRNKSFAEHLQALPWTDSTLSSIVEEALSSQHLGFCRLVDDQLATPAEVVFLPNYTQYYDASALCGRDVERLLVQGLSAGAAGASSGDESNRLRGANLSLLWFLTVTCFLVISSLRFTL